MSRRRGRPSIRDGEQSTSLNVRVTHSQFDTVFEFSRQLGITLPEAARIKLDALMVSEEDLGRIRGERETARELREQAKAILEAAKRERALTVQILDLIATARSASEVLHIAGYGLMLLMEDSTNGP